MNIEFLNKKWSFATVCKGGIERYYYYSFLLLEEGSREVFYCGNSVSGKT
mgnify:CR=1 FL=1